MQLQQHMRQDASAPAAHPRRPRRGLLARVAGNERFWLGALVIALLLALWAISFAFFDADATRFPSPHELYAAVVQLLAGYAGGTLWAHVAQSCKLVLMGFAAAAAIGVPLGIWMGWSYRAEALAGSVFSLLRPIPPLAWIPLAILWFGLGDGAKIFVICYAAFVPCVINAQTGVRNIDRNLLQAAITHGAGKRELLFDVVIPGALPMIFTGLRLSLQSCWTTLVAAELVGSFVGLGRVLSMSAQDMKPGMILLAMLLVGVLGVAMTRALTMLERRVLRWTA
jgi:taurine transport system permease protein